MAPGRIEADRAAGRITAAQPEQAEADLTARHGAETQPWRTLLHGPMLLPLPFVAGCLALTLGR